ncbi:ComEC/Rec2 family competence protein [Sphingobium sufflavum]|uniref:ComEC/Rec2 family competence protein n=1 Tax=Sphingobium sufflavum TaxID=1129547 RepID=UPI001F3E83FA|nr:ComEC/Rec2 family competence protein [Sphingobium sufflavum]MCE7797760.1 ComEC/Rec2 family competence protein [Sphingobium sufflavum]
MQWLGRVFDPVLERLLRGEPERVLEAERAQLPLWSPVALGVGIVAWFLLPTRLDWMLLIGLCLGGAALLLGFGAAAGRLVRALGICLLLVALGCLLPWGKAMLVGQTVLARPAMVRMEASVITVEAMSGRGIARILLKPVDRPDLPDLIRVNADLEDMPREIALRRGDRLRLRARLMPPAGPAFPGGYDYARRAWFDGIGATGRLLPPLEVVHRDAGTGPGIREQLSGHVASRVGGGAGALAVTMATGDRGRIAPEDEDAMRQSGLTHLLSISGVHVTALIGGVVFLMFKLLALSSRLALRWPLLLIAAGAGAGAGIGYTLLTGAEVPTIRSCVTALLVMAGLALGREAISMRLLACGALFVMLLWPEAVIGPSFQLSFAAVAAIVTLYEHPRARALVQARAEPVWAKALRFLAGLFITGVAVEMVLMPIVLFHFHKSGLLGAFANMVAIPLTELVVMPAEALALALDLLGLGAPLWWVVEQALRLLLFIAHLVAGQSLAVALTPAIMPLAFGLAMTGLLWCLLWRTRLRWWGLPCLALGLSGYALARAPDILVSSDGRHVAVRTRDGGVALLRDRAGDYMRGQMAEQAAFGGQLQALADLPNAHCSEDFCTLVLIGSGRRYHVLVTRSRLSVPWTELIRHCGAADIVIADRRLPTACRARWLTLDRKDLALSGAAAIDLTTGQVRRSRDPRDEHPWQLRLGQGMPGPNGKPPTTLDPLDGASPGAGSGPDKAPQL